MGNTLEPQAACGFTGEDMAQVMSDLLPPGPVWPRDPETTLQKTLAGLAEEFARLLARDCDLLTESYPGTATETITDWERVCGLPDPCTGPLDTLQQRRMAVLQKLAMRGGQSRQYYIDGAAALGFEISAITEFRPLIADEARAGDACYFQSEGRAEPAIGRPPPPPDPKARRDRDWWYVWQITTTEDMKTVYMRADESEAGDRLAEYGNSMLTCWVEQAKPAHTFVIYAFGSQPPAPLP